MGIRLFAFPLTIFVYFVFVPFKICQCLTRPSQRAGLVERKYTPPDTAWPQSAVCLSARQIHLLTACWPSCRETHWPSFEDWGWGILSLRLLLTSVSCEVKSEYVPPTAHRPLTHQQATKWRAQLVSAQNHLLQVSFSWDTFLASLVFVLIMVSYLCFRSVPDFCSSRLYRPASLAQLTVEWRKLADKDFFCISAQISKVELLCWLGKVSAISWLL